MDNHNPGYNEDFDRQKLDALYESLRELLTEELSRAEFLVRLEVLFTEFNSLVKEDNPRRTVINFLNIAEVQLAYFWNLSRRLGTTLELTERATYESYREVNHLIVYSKYMHGELSRRAALSNIHEGFTDKMGFELDM